MAILPGTGQPYESVPQSYMRLLIGCFTLDMLEKKQTRIVHPSSKGYVQTHF